MTDLVERKPGYQGVQIASTGSGGTLLPQTFGDVVAFASVMARADLALPKHLRGNDGACMAVAMQAVRWGMDPFAVANKTSSVNDRLAYEAQLVAAVVHMRAGIKGRPQYEYTGEGATRKCKVTCTLEDGATREYETPTFSQITVKNSPLWKSDPDQQLGYFAIRSWARRYTPEVILGVYDRDEIAEAQPLNVTPKANTSLSERLAQATVKPEGFNTVNSATIEGSGVVMVNSATGEVLGTYDLTGVTVEPVEEEEPLSDVGTPFTEDYLTDWAEALIGVLDQFETGDKLKELWGEDEIKARFMALKAKDEPLAKRLHAAVSARVKALA
jgi:hypothetical protein